MNAPQQLFDFTAQLGALEAESNPSRELEIADVAVIPADLPLFDVDAFEKIQVPLQPRTLATAEISQIYREHGAHHLYMLARLPPPVLRHLLSSWNPKDFFAFLSHKHFAEFKKTLFRGFQVTPQQLRNPAVLNRLQTHFRAHLLDLYALFLASRFGKDESGPCDNPDLLVSMKVSPPQLGNIMGRISLAAEYGPFDAVLFAVAHAHFEAFAYYSEQFQNPDDFVREVTAQRAQMKEKALRDAQEQSTPESAPEADSPAAQWWKARAEELRESLDATMPLAQRASEHDQITKKIEADLQSARKERDKLRESEKQLALNWEKRLKNAQKRADEVLSGQKQQLERETRKLQKSEREARELETELKKVKKQLRLAQQVLEDERKTILALKAQIETPAEQNVEVEVEKTLPTPSVPTRQPEPPQPLTPLDDIFEWRADGRLWRLTPRQVKRMIDTNDEDNLWQVQMALQVLESTHKENYNRFFFRLKSEDPSYALVLTQPTQRVLVDASNVTRYQTNKSGRGLLRNLLQMRDELRRLGCWPIILWADASLRHNVDEGKKYGEMLARGEIFQTDKGVEADEMLAREARKWGASVVTNDARFFHKVSPEFEPPRITFRIFDGVVVVDSF